MFDTTDLIEIKNVGFVPADWQIKRLEEVSEFITKGATPTTYGFEWTESGIPFFKSDCIKEGKFIFGSFQYISDAAHKALNRSKIQSGDILISITGDLGKVAIVPKNITEGNINQHIARIRVDDTIADKKFVYHWINQEKIRNYYNLIKTGLAYPQISLVQVRNTEIPLPDLKEQQKIARILSTWDKAIELKEELAQQKIKMKKGLMKKLLTGKVRLPGFFGEWEEVSLGEVLKERKETGYINLELLAITAERGIVRRDEVDIKNNSSEDKSRYKRILPLDIGYNTMRMWQGVSGVSKYEGIVSPAYTVLKPTNKVDSFFIGYLFKLPKVVDVFRRYSQGLVDDTLNLKYENFKVINVIIPPDAHEQKAIAQILICFDKEIETVKKELAALKQQKKGLMQLLLTGKVRVKY